MQKRPMKRPMDSSHHRCQIFTDYVPRIGISFFFAGARCLSAGHHLRLTRGPAGNRTTTGSLSASPRTTPYQLSRGDTFHKLASVRTARPHQDPPQNETNQKKHRQAIKAFVAMHRDEEAKQGIQDQQVAAQERTKYRLFIFSSSVADVALKARSHKQETRTYQVH